MQLARTSVDFKTGSKKACKKGVNCKRASWIEVVV